MSAHRPPSPSPPPPPPPWPVELDDPAPAPAVGRLPPWVHDLRLRLGLDQRALVWVGAAALAVVVAAWWLRPAPGPVEEALPLATEGGPAADDGGAAAGTSASTTAPAEGSSTTAGEVVAHAAGAVARPGVYPLPGGARVDDLVRAAGGLLPDADDSRLNLAAPLADGARLYVPRRGEAEPPAVVDVDGGTPLPADPQPPEGGADSGPAADEGTPVDLNRATEEELDTLPGVGPAIAAAIVAFREENGGFASVDDLLDVRGIGEAKLAEIRPRVTV